MRLYATLVLLLLSACTPSIAGFGGGSFYDKGDDAAIHDNVAGEIAAVGSITPAGADYVLLEDAGSGNVKGQATLTAIFAALGSGGGTAPTVDSTLATCQGLTPAEGDLCYPTDSPYTLVARSAGTWSYRYPGIGFDVTPPPSAGWTARNSASVTAAGGVRLMPASVTDQWRAETRALPSDPTTTPYYVEMIVQVSTRAVGEIGVCWHEAATTELVCLTSHAGWMTHQDYAAGYGATGGTINGQIGAGGGFVGGPDALFFVRLEEDATNRRVKACELATGTCAQLGSDDARTNHLTADGIGWAVFRGDGDMAPIQALVHYETGAL
mgnify:CR=1 FL=1